MAYVNGETLEQRLERGDILSEREALRIVRAVADALAYAWDEHRLLHRDIKPGNIMLDHRGRVFLLDLGLAKSLVDERGITLANTVVGTPRYMSPEQAQGSGDLGVTSDIYSLGATLFHLIVGSPPFDSDSALAIMSQHVHRPLPCPRERNPAIGDACSRLVEHMMAKKPEDRCPNWQALVAECDRLLEGSA
jgi:serine/threonine-protein kinase